MAWTNREQFFYEHAGYSYDPKSETVREGRARGAKRLAIAEERAQSESLEFQWELDPDVDSSDFDDSSEPWALWQVLMVDDTGLALDSLGGVDFGRDGDPHGENYARVVQAEIAAEHFYRADRAMTLHDALQIVYELAQQNVIDELDNAEEHARQSEALNTFHDFVVNHSEKFE